MNSSYSIPASLLNLDNYRDEGIQILFVEHNQTDFELICNKLRKNGLLFKAVLTHSLSQLHHCLEHDEFHLILSNYQLPNFSAEEVFQVLKNSSLNIPLIVIADQMTEEKAASLIQYGIEDCLNKQNTTRLISVIQRSIQNSLAHKNLILAEHKQMVLHQQLNLLEQHIVGFSFHLQTDPNLQFQWVSEGSIRLLNQTPQSLLHHANAFFERIHPEDRQQLIAELTNHSKNQKSLYWEGCLLSKHKQAPRWISIQANLTQYALYQQWEGVCLDITEMKNSRNKLAQLKKELANQQQEFKKDLAKERENMAQELHDELGSSLTALQMNCAGLRTHQLLNEQAREQLDDMQTLLTQLQMCSQRIANNLRPHILDENLISALTWQVQDFSKRSGITTNFYTNVDEITLESDAKTALFRTLQESFTNIVKHAQATKVKIELFVTDQEITLEIQDNGVGIRDIDLFKPTSFGLRGMRERISALKGWIDISGSNNQGTTLMVSMPCPKKGRKPS